MQTLHQDRILDFQVFKRTLKITEGTQGTLTQGL